MILGRADHEGKPGGGRIAEISAAVRAPPTALRRLPGHAPVTGGWRRGRDSNPRCPYGHNGFRDRPIQPLSHLSGRACNELRARSQGPDDTCGRIVACSASQSPERTPVVRGATVIHMMWPAPMWPEVALTGTCGRQELRAGNRRDVPRTRLAGTASAARTPEIARGARECLASRARNSRHRGGRSEPRRAP